MKYLILILSLTGGLLSFSSYGLDFTLPPVTTGTINHEATVDSDGYFNTTWYGVPYICFNCVFNSDGKTASGTWYRNDGSYDVPFPDKKPEPDKPEPPAPDVKPPAPDVKPPEPDKPKPPSGSYVSEKLAAISRMTPDMLYTSFRIDYDKSDTLYNNEMLAKAFLQKLSNVTPPSYYAVDHIQSFMDDWQKTYSYLRPSGLRNPQKNETGIACCDLLILTQIQ